MKKRINYLVGLLAYVLFVLAPVLGKLAHWRSFAHWGWWRATGLLWGPWLLLAVMAVLTVLLRRTEHLSKP